VKADSVGSLSIVKCTDVLTWFGKAPVTPNPFFGKQVKKASVVPIKDDFNPFKHGKVAEPAQTCTFIRILLSAGGY
jgi:hypothetical protein